MYMYSAETIGSVRHREVDVKAQCQRTTYKIQGIYWSLNEVGIIFSQKFLFYAVIAKKISILLKLDRQAKQILDIHRYELQFSYGVH